MIGPSTRKKPTFDEYLLTWWKVHLLDEKLAYSVKSPAIQKICPQASKDTCLKPVAQVHRTNPKVSGSLSDSIARIEPSGVSLPINLHAPTHLQLA